MRRGIAAALGLVALAGAARAQDVPCGEPYTIRRGDTLQRIAERAYGPEASFRTLWDANRARLGWRNPSLIEVGEVIEVPCPEADATEAAADGVASPDAAPAAPPEALPEGAGVGPLRVAVSPAGGAEEARAVAALARAAFEEAPGRAVEVEIVEDLDAEPLDLVDRGFALSLPWPDPGCDRQPAASLRPACEAFLWSTPVYERVVVVFRRASLDEATAEAPPTMCLPASLSALGLYEEAEGTVEADAAGCLAALAEGRVDLAAAPAGAAARALGALSAEAAPREVYELARLVPLAAAASAADPEGEALIERLEAGLAALRERGAWYETVRAAVADEVPAAR